jgi:hypothetical protein
MDQDLLLFDGAEAMIDELDGRGLHAGGGYRKDPGQDSNRAFAVSGLGAALPRLALRR